MSACLRPSGCEAAGKNARTGRAPNLVGHEPGRACSVGDRLDYFRCIHSERYEPRSSSLAILACAGLDDGEVARLNGDDLSAEARRFKRARSWANALCHEDRCSLAELSGHCRKRRLRASFCRTRIDSLIGANEEGAEKPRLRSARIEVITNDQDAIVLDNDGSGCRDRNRTGYLAGRSRVRCQWATLRQAPLLP